MSTIKELIKYFICKLFIRFKTSKLFEKPSRHYTIGSGGDYANWAELVKEQFPLKENITVTHLCDTESKDVIIANPPGICTVCGKDRGPTIVCQGCGWVDPPTKQK